MPGGGRGRGRRPGMMDVARAAGVSHQTVSRVLNAPDTVRPATLEAVRAAIAELGYRPNAAARALVTDSMRLVGVLTTSADFFGPASTAAAIEVAARRAGYGTLVTSLQVADTDEVSEALAFLIGRGVDGVIAVAPREGTAAAVRAAARSVPVVVVADGFPPGEGIDVVSVDQELGARQAVAHLVAGGRRHVAHLAGPQDWFDAAARQRGWRQGLEDLGLAPGPVVVGDWSTACGYAAARRLLEGAAEVDALLCANDLMALGALAAARDLGVAVPQELAVVGVDDVPGADVAAPALSTVRQPFAELGRVCLEVLLEAIGGAAASSHSIAPVLVVRASS